MPKPRPYDRILNHGITPDQAAVAAALEPLDKVASETEARWGIGVLERLVSPETAAKFASARVKLDNAIDAEDLAEVTKRAAVMIRGWQAMDAEAKALGNKPGEGTLLWACQAEDGTKYLFVPHEADTAVFSRKWPDHQVWSMREVVRVLQSHELALVSKTKELFPGAVVTRAERKKVNMDEEIPF
jgi:hypothetical protein